MISICFKILIKWNLKLDVKSHMLEDGNPPNANICVTVSKCHNHISLMNYHLIKLCLLVTKKLEGSCEIILLVVKWEVVIIVTQAITKQR